MIGKTGKRTIHNRYSTYKIKEQIIEIKISCTADHASEKSDLCNPMKGKTAMKKREYQFSFTLIELLVSKTCQICVSPLYYFQKSTPLFLKGERGAGREGNFFSREKKCP
ncbi:MAG: hypothetical protein IJC21_08605, partial [Lentisphaeria bacterium]|nr:hypothetical protein [Lentisphaeria bacterium]